MGRLVRIALALGVSWNTALMAQFPPGYVDPLPVLKAADEAIGASRLRCLTIAGSGYTGKVGQNVTQDTDWPRGEPLTRYERVLNFENKSSVERFDRKPGQNPGSWKYGVGWLGGTPLQLKERQTFVVSGNLAWHMDGEGSPPESLPANAELWQLDMWLNPPGFIKAAMQPGANPKAIWRWEMVESGRDGATTGKIEKVIVVSITMLGKYRVNATINSKNMIQRIETKFPHPVLGDMNYEHEYTEWRTIDGITFPAGWHHHEGYDDERFKPTITGGHNAFGGTFDKIQPNVCAAVPPVPDSVKNAGLQPARVEMQKLADGVWLLGGSTHNSVAIEFRDFVTVVEAPLDEARSLAVIEQIVKLVPGKPVRFVVNTHDHFDHSGGLRTYTHIGATIVTHKRNRVFYEEELLNYVPRTLQPDMMTLYQPTEIREGYVMEIVAENYVISDGVRNLHISYVQPLAHAEGMLMAYLPKEKIAIEADLYNTGSGEVRLANEKDSMQSFYDHVKRLGEDVATVVPIHGQPVSWSDFLRAAGKQ